MDSNKLKVVASVIIVVLVIIGGYFMFKGSHREKFTATNAKIDVTQGARIDGDSQMPVEGFPTNIPIEVENIYQSYRADYAEHGLTQYTVAFKSSKTATAIHDAYSKFMKDSGYTMSADSNSLIAGTKGNTSLMITIAEGDNKKENVIVNYLVRKQ